MSHAKKEHSRKAWSKVLFSSKIYNACLAPVIAKDVVWQQSIPQWLEGVDLPFPYLAEETWELWWTGSEIVCDYSTLQIDVFLWCKATKHTFHVPRPTLDSTLSVIKWKMLLGKCLLVLSKRPGLFGGKQHLLLVRKLWLQTSLVVSSIPAPICGINNLLANTCR